MHTVSSHGLTIEFDEREYHHDDPGAGTPVVVRMGKHTGTYWCAVDTGELDGGEVTLTDAQVRWLRSKENEVDEFMARYESKRQ